MACWFGEDSYTDSNKHVHLQLQAITQNYHRDLRTYEQTGLNAIARSHSRKIFHQQHNLKMFQSCSVLWLQR